MKNTIAVIFCSLVGLAIFSGEVQAQAVSQDVQKNKICMVDDVFKGEEMIKVEIDGQVYYGCCEPCIEALLIDSTFRYAIDPFSGKKIGKADAFIVVGEDGVGLQYFDSKNNFESFLKENTK